MNQKEVDASGEVLARGKRGSPPSNPTKNTRPSSSHMQTSVEQAGGSAAERRVRPGGARRRAEIGCTCVEASDQTNTRWESEAQLETRDLIVRPESLPPQRHRMIRGLTHAADTHAPTQPSHAQGLSRMAGQHGAGAARQSSLLPRTGKRFAPKSHLQATERLRRRLPSKAQALAISARCIKTGA